MTAKSRHLQKKLDVALRALQQIEAIANTALDRPGDDSDLHWVLDGIGDLAHYALEVADDQPPADAAEGEDADLELDPEPDTASAAALDETLHPSAEEPRAKSQGRPRRSN